MLSSTYNTLKTSSQLMKGVYTTFRNSAIIIYLSLGFVLLQIGVTNEKKK